MVGLLAIFVAAANLGAKSEKVNTTAEKVEAIGKDYVNQKQFDDRMEDLKTSVGSRFDNLESQNQRIEQKIDELRK